jgi:putative transposase
VKYAWIERHRREYEIAEMCQALSVSVSGFRAWRRGGRRLCQRLSDAQMVAMIRAIDREFKGA